MAQHQVDLDSQNIDILEGIFQICTFFKFTIHVFKFFVKFQTVFLLLKVLILWKSLIIFLTLYFKPFYHTVTGIKWRSVVFLNRSLRVALIGWKRHQTLIMSIKKNILDINKSTRNQDYISVADTTRWLSVSIYLK